VNWLCVTHKIGFAAVDAGSNAMPISSVAPPSLVCSDVMSCGVPSVPSGLTVNR
jgi:hypothetical protein